VNDTIEIPADIPLEVIDECLGEIYFWFEGEAFASAPVGAE
jgi:hypothetical protein